MSATNEDICLGGGGSSSPEEEEPPPQYSSLNMEEEEERSLDDVLSDLKFGRFHVLVLLLGGTAYFAVCSELMVFVFLSKPVQLEWHLREMVFPWLPFFNGVACIAGQYLLGVLSDKYGRQLTFALAVFVCSVFGVASSVATNFVVLVLFRSLVAFGRGGLAAVAFILPIEFFPLQKRNYMIMITMCGTGGAAFAGAMAWFILPKYGWRYFVGACATPFLFTLVLRLFINVESPRFLMVKGKKEEAWKVLKKISVINNCAAPTGKLLCPPKQEMGRIKDLFCKELWSRTTVMSLVWFFQATGFWGVTTYLPQYMSDMLGMDNYFAMFTVFVSEIPGLILAMILIEKHMLGRIRCLLFFSFITIVLLASFAIVSITKLMFVQTFTIMTCYAFMVPIYSILNTFTPELYPTTVRNTALGWMYIINDLSGLVTPFLGAMLLQSHVVWLYPVVWALFFVLQFVTLFRFKRETADQKLTDCLATNQSEGPFQQSLVMTS